MTPPSDEPMNRFRGATTRGDGTAESEPAGAASDRLPAPPRSGPLCDCPTTIACLLALAHGAGATLAHPTGFDIADAPLAGGGGTCSSGRYSLQDTLGQLCPGIAASERYGLADGFWPTLNLPPVAAAQTLGIRTDQVARLTLAKLLGRTIDADNDPLALLGLDAVSAAGGSVALVGNAVVYTPPVGYVGVDLFAYTLTDGAGNVVTGTVEVTVTPSSATSINVVYGPAVEAGCFVVRFAGVPGYTYTIETSVSLSPPYWSKHLNLTAPASAGPWGIGVFEIREPLGSEPMRIYRTIWPAY